MERPGETAEERGRSWLPWVGLAAILVVYLALATLQSFATRLQWGPDEPAHIIYVRSLAMDGRLPSLTQEEREDAYLPGSARTHQAHHPPLYYALASVVWRMFSYRPDDTVRYRDEKSGVEHSFTVPGPVRPVRLLSVLLGVVTLLCTWATARTAFPHRPAVWLWGAGLAAFTPMFTYMSGVINNDSLLIALFAATAWQWARIMRFGASTRDVLALGVLVGVLLNVKETGLALVALSVVALAVEPGASSRRQRVERIGVLLGLVALVGGWWFLRNWVIYGRPLVYPYHRPLLELPEGERRALLPLIPVCLFLFVFVPLDVIYPRVNFALIAGFFGCLTLVAGGGLAAALLRRRRRAMPRYEAHSLALWPAAAVIVLAGVIRGIMTIDWTMGTSGGRYLVSVLPMLTLASARGLSALFGDGRAAQIALAAICVALLAVNVYAIWATAAGYQTLGLGAVPGP